jgi:hypothetical protein
MLDRLAQAAERQNQLGVMVERLVRENGELREEMDNLRRGGTRLVPLRPRVVAQDALDRSERGE